VEMMFFKPSPSFSHIQPCSSFSSSFSLWPGLLGDTFKNLNNVHQKNTAVLITGCDSGIGYSACLYFLQKGVTVFAGCLTETGKQNLSQQASSAQIQPNQLFAIILDVTKQEDVDEAVKFVEQNLPQTIDNFSILNNAGIGDGSYVESTPLHDYRKVHEVNFFGAVRITKAFLPLIRTSRKPGGRVINLTSIAGRMAVP